MRSLDDVKRNAYSAGIRVWDEVTCALDENIAPVALLVHDAADVTIVVDPGSRGLPSEALDPAEGRVLLMYQCMHISTTVGLACLYDHYRTLF